MKLICGLWRKSRGNDIVFEGGIFHKMDVLKGSHITQEKIAYSKMRKWLCHSGECWKTLNIGSRHQSKQ